MKVSLCKVCVCTIERGKVHCKCCHEKISTRALEIKMRTHSWRTDLDIWLEAELQIIYEHIHHHGSVGE